MLIATGGLGSYNYSLVSTIITWACRSVEALQLLDYNMFCVEEETHNIILNLLISTALQFHWLLQVMVLARQGPTYRDI